MYLNQIEKDILTEVATISLSSAATSLGKMLKERVEVSVPTLNIETIDTASDRIGLAEELVTEILLRMSGDLSGVMLILLSPQKAKILEQMLNKGNSLPVLSEVGNILAGNALKSMSMFLKLNVFESIPDVATDMRRALIISSVFQLGEETDRVLILGTTLFVPKIDLSANIYFLFDEQAANKITEALKAYGSINRS